MRTQWLKLGLVAAAAAAGLVLYPGASAQQPRPGDKLPAHRPTPGDGQSLVVQLCDGETNLEVKGVSPDGRLSPEQAKDVSGQLMGMWMAKQPKEVAEAWARAAAAAQEQEPKKPTPPRPAKKEGPANVPDESGSKQTVDFSARDYSVWKKELERTVAYGDQIFHDDKLLESTNGVSCAMCHPHGSNTHPETYPKFQVQLRRVALLRDMINWCIENPSRGKKLEAEDPKMHALEAYIMSQRKGVAMEPGKH